MAIFLKEKSADVAGKIIATPLLRGGFKVRLMEKITAYR